MTKLIESERLADGLKHHYYPIDQKRELDRQWALGYNAGLDRAMHSITYAPTVDAEPVRHGEWGETVCIGYDGLHPKYAKPCSVCGKYSEEYLRQYCSSCGARLIVNQRIVATLD